MNTIQLRHKGQTLSLNRTQAETLQAALSEALASPAATTSAQHRQHAPAQGREVLTDC